MSERYKVKNQDGLYFMTITVVGWIDLFSRKTHRDIIIESLRYCQQNKGLLLYAYVIMSNHIHIVAQAKEGIELSSIIRDMKKFTAKTLWETIGTTNESRREWLQYLFSYFARKNKLAQEYQIWTHDNHPIELWSTKVIAQKIAYIHENPIRTGLVDKAEDWVYSSQRNYMGMNGILDVIVLDLL